MGARRKLPLRRIATKPLRTLTRFRSKYNELQNAQEDLIRGNVKETQKLLTELQAAQENLQKKEDLLRQLEQTLDAKNHHSMNLRLSWRRGMPDWLNLKRFLMHRKKLSRI